jgi:hypothetical protein
LIGNRAEKDSPSRPRRVSIGVSAPREAKMADDAHDLSEIVNGGVKTDHVAAQKCTGLAG